MITGHKVRIERVIHRIGGLENHLLSLACYFWVIHRIGGLEKQTST